MTKTQTAVSNAAAPTDLMEPDLLQTGLALQEQGLQILLAEMQALAGLMPGALHVPPSDEDAENCFDNMPV